MEFHNGHMKMFGATSVSMVLFHAVCFTTFCIHSTVETKSLKPTLTPSSLNKPTIYVDIPSWENRTTIPRFLIHKEHLRRRLESGDNDSNSDIDSSQLSSYSKSTNGRSNSNSAIHEKYSIKEKESVTFPTIGSFEDTDKINDDSSLELEQLLAERKGTGMAATSDGKSETAKRFEISSDDQKINFPKDKTNPCNRLQINPEEEVVTTQNISNESPNAINSTKQSSNEDYVSIEIGNRDNFSGGRHKKNVTAGVDISVDLIKDVVPTFQLTMHIIQQSKWNDENVAFSPLSMANVLSMLLLGAGGETFKELSFQLEKQDRLLSPSSVSFPWNIHRYHEAFKRLLNYLKTSSGNGVILNSASEIFVNKSYPIIEKFEHDLLNFYDAPLESFNFGKDGYIFMDKLNKWVREKTQNQIQSILAEPPSPETTMGIINAIYFKGSWETPFSEKLTRWRDFSVQPKEKLKAKMMINILNIPYVESDLYRMAALPYKENKTALFLILPKGNHGINDLKIVENSLSKDALKERIGLMNETKIALTLPKLKFSSDGEMASILQNFGLSSMFNPEKANFSGISPDGLHLSSLLHRAVVEINEKGTQASAVTLGTADRIFDDLPTPFSCDKPFLFFIYHISADTILFWGRVVRPETDGGRIS